MAFNCVLCKREMKIKNMSYPERRIFIQLGICSICAVKIYDLYFVSEVVEKELKNIKTINRKVVM